MLFEIIKNGGLHITIRIFPRKKPNFTENITSVNDELGRCLMWVGTVQPTADRQRVGGWTACTFLYISLTPQGRNFLEAVNRLLQTLSANHTHA